MINKLRWIDLWIRTSRCWLRSEKNFFIDMRKIGQHFDRLNLRDCKIFHICREARRFISWRQSNTVTPINFYHLQDPFKPILLQYFIQIDSTWNLITLFLDRSFSLCRLRNGAARVKFIICQQKAWNTLNSV